MWDVISGIVLDVVSAILLADYTVSRHVEKQESLFFRLGAGNAVKDRLSRMRTSPTPYTQSDWGANVTKGGFPQASDWPPPYDKPEDDAELDAESLVARWISPIVDPLFEPIWNFIEKVWGKMNPLRWFRVLPIIPVSLICFTPFLVLVVPVTLIFPFAVMFDGNRDWRLRLIALTLPVGVIFNILGCL